MNQYAKWSVFLLRLSLGWLMFHAGIVKILNPRWSAAGYLSNAKNFTGFYQSLTDPGILPIINLVNEWGLLLLGVSLILGIWVRYSTIPGAILMMLYYFPLAFPKPDANSYIVDDHIIYALALLVLGAIGAGQAMGLDGWWKKRSENN